MLTQERLKELLHYDPETGVWTWLVDRRGSARAGSVAGSFNGYGYRQIRIDGRIYRAPRLAFLYMTGEWPAGQVDHRNRVRDDDRLVNLRVASPTQNNGNSSLRRDNTSGCKGVHWNKSSNCWRAYIRERDGQKHLGYYTNRDEACAAYDRAAAATFGEFANPARDA